MLTGHQQAFFFLFLSVSRTMVGSMHAVNRFEYRFGSPLVIVGCMNYDFPATKGSIPSMYILCTRMEFKLLRASRPNNYAAGSLPIAALPSRVKRLLLSAAVFNTMALQTRTAGTQGCEPMQGSVGNVAIITAMSRRKVGGDSFPDGSSDSTPNQMTPSAQNKKPTFCISLTRH